MSTSPFTRHHARQAQRLPGVVDRWIPGRAFGFVRTDDGQEYFLHRFDCPDHQDLARGDRVTFCPLPQPGKPTFKAARVELLTARRQP